MAIIIFILAPAFASASGTNCDRQASPAAVIQSRSEEGTLRSVREALLMFYGNGSDLTAQLERELLKVGNAIDASNLNFRITLKTTLVGSRATSGVVKIAFSIWRADAQRFDEDNVVYLRTYAIESFDADLGRLVADSPAVQLIDPVLPKQEIEAQARGLLRSRLSSALH